MQRAFNYAGDKAYAFRMRGMYDDGKHHCGKDKNGNYYEDPMADGKACCWGMFNFSYLISAPLHYQGYHEFWDAADMLGKAIVTFDMIIHICLWAAVLVLDSWIVSKGDAADNAVTNIKLSRDLEVGALVCTCLVFAGLLLAQIFGWLGQPAGKAFPTTVALVVGGGLASLIFTVVDLIQGAGHAMTEAAEDSVADAASLRRGMVWLVGLKVLALATAQANIAFWGACEQAHKLNNLCALMDGPGKIPSPE